MPVMREQRQVQGRPRYNVIDEENVGVYHVWTRCARRAWLCGPDPVTGIDFQHRKAWFFERLEQLTAIFAIDACVWAILGNHYHLIIRNRPDLAAQWTDEEVVRRWWQLCPERRDEHGRPAPPTDLEIRSILADPPLVAEYRERLKSVSWFMKSMNEWISRRANAEERLVGTFWEGRYKCRNLLDVGAILACSIYVDLNEIRADLAATPEDSPNTSAYRRILARILRQAREEERGIKSADSTTDYLPDDPDYWMCPVDEQDRAPLLGPEVEPSCDVEAVASVAVDSASDCPVVKPWRHGFLPIGVDEYLELLDWTGRQLVAGKRGAIDEAYPPILERLGLRPSSWLKSIDQFESWFHGAVGRAESMVAKAAHTGRHWIQGLNRCRDLFT